MPVDRHDHPVWRQFQFPAHRLNDPAIGLMGHEPIHLVPRQAVGRQRLIHNGGQLADRMPEHFTPIHPQVTGQFRTPDRAVDIKEVAKVALGVEVCRKDATIITSTRPIAGMEEGSTGPVAEQDAGRPV